METIGWLIAFIVLLVIEAITLNLTTVWFAIGSAFAYLCSLFGLGFPLQFTVFVVISLLLLFFTKPLAQKYISGHFIKTNADSLIGQTARTTSVIDNRNGFGSAILNGQEWSAISSDDSVVIEADTDVIIKEIRGVKLVVAKESNQ